MTLKRSWPANQTLIGIYERSKKIFKLEQDLKDHHFITLGAQDIERGSVMAVLIFQLVDFVPYLHWQLSLLSTRSLQLEAEKKKPNMIKILVVTKIK